MDTQLEQIARIGPHTGGSDPLTLVGTAVDVPLVTGGARRYINLDHAASTPCLSSVKDAVDALLPWYSSVHRGAGFKSQVSTAAYEGAREAVHSFVNARPNDAVVFTRNTTDAINLLGTAVEKVGLPPNGTVLAFAAEHHSNLLPWRRHRVRYLPVPDSPEHALESLEQALATARSDHVLVAVTGASNVTGEIWPYADIARLAHRYGARVLLDAAQLAPHRPIDMATDDIDYLALSGHKLYAPFGAGALIGRPDWLSAGEPFLAGGGAVRYVGLDAVLWADLPDRQEAGSPNVVGAVALGVACRTLQAVDRAGLRAVEEDLLDVAQARLAAIPGVAHYRMWSSEHPRIGVRHGCFCAHPLMVALLGIDADVDASIYHSLRRGDTVSMPGAVRLSMGLGTERADIAALVEAVETIATDGPRWTYRSAPDGSDCWPDPDPRPLPVVPFDLAP